MVTASRLAVPAYHSQSFSPAVVWLLAINSAVFMVRYVAPQTYTASLYTFGLVPSGIVDHWRLWQFVTYLFLHANVVHFAGNMIALWFFGPDVERRWGSIRFARFYCLCGIVAGVGNVIIEGQFGAPDRVTIGASGGLFGILIAFAVLFPQRTIYLFGLVPMAAKYFAMMVAGVSLVYGAGGFQSTNAHAANAVAAIFAYLMTRHAMALESRVRGYLDTRFEDWERSRAEYDLHAFIDSDKKGQP